jgi:Co/Zn/Cd efflux system component
MHVESMNAWKHDHVFLGADHARNERRTRIVIALCGAMMVVEIGGGILFRSMALVADGLHMSTHAAALFIAATAYAFARRRADDGRFTFGTGKLGDLAGFTSAIVLAMIALLIAWESVGRLISPLPIAFNEAIPIAALGLGVNLLSAWLLRDEHDHDHHASVAGGARTQCGCRDHRVARPASAKFLQGTLGKRRGPQPRDDRGRTMRLGPHFKMRHYGY